MHVIAGLDRLSGKSDDLSVTSNRFTRSDRAQGNFMSAGYEPLYLDLRCPIKDCARRQDDFGNRHVIGRVQMYCYVSKRDIPYLCCGDELNVTRSHKPASYKSEHGKSLMLSITTIPE